MRRTPLALPPLAITALAITALAVSLPTVAHASVFADSLVASSNVHSFGSGSVAGAPDNGGLWLGDTFDPPQNLGSITVAFDNALTNGAGADLRIYDIGSSAEETFNVFLSSDNLVFTLIGEYSATNNLIDWSGLFSDPVSYVRLTNTSRSVSADIDAIEGFHLASNNNGVPEPSTWAMMIAGFGAVGGAMRRRRTMRVSYAAI